MMLLPVVLHAARCFVKLVIDVPCMTVPSVESQIADRQARADAEHKSRRGPPNCYKGKSWFYCYEKLWCQKMERGAIFRRFDHILFLNQSSIGQRKIYD